LGALFLLKHFLFLLPEFCLCPWLLGGFISFETSSCFCDFDLAPILLGALFLPKRIYLRFCNFDLAPSLLPDSFPSNYFLQSQWAGIELDLPTAFGV
jgi:hypothetical protein